MVCVYVCVNVHAQVWCLYGVCVCMYSVCVCMCVCVHDCFVLGCMTIMVMLSPPSLRYYSLYIGK